MSFESINWEINPSTLSKNSNLRDVKYEIVFLTLQIGWGYWWLTWFCFSSVTKFQKYNNFGSVAFVFRHSYSFKLVLLRNLYKHLMSSPKEEMLVYHDFLHRKALCLMCCLLPHQNLLVPRAPLPKLWVHHSQHKVIHIEKWVFIRW